MWTRTAKTLIKFMGDGGHQLHRETDNTPVTDPTEMRKLLGTALEKILHNLAGKALLLRDR